MLMGSQSSKGKINEPKFHIYYAVRLKKHNKVSVFDSDDFNPDINVKNGNSEVLIKLDSEDMNRQNSDFSRSKLSRSDATDNKSSDRFKEAVQYWATASRESVINAKRPNPSATDDPRFEWDEQRNRPTMASSRSRLSWTNIQDCTKRNVRSTAAQAGSNVSVKENSIFKSKSYKGSTCSASSLSHKDGFESKPRSQSETYDRRRKRSLKNVDQQDGLFETKSIYSSDNLSDCTNKTRDLDLRLKGGGLAESKERNKPLENSEPWVKKSENDKELIIRKESDDAVLSDDFIDSRWQALCLTKEKELVLVPCPTCGRKFSEEAAYRHFPICSKVKEKGAKAKASKNNNVRPKCSSPSTPSFINVMADDNLRLSDKRDGNKKSKPVAFTFTRGGQVCQMPPPESKPVIKSSEQCKKTNMPIFNKNCVIIESPVNNKKGSGNSLLSKGDQREKRNRKSKVSVPTPDGVRKSASIWRKSVKDFKTIAEQSSTPAKVKKSNSSSSHVSSSSSKGALPPKTLASKGSRGNSNLSTSDNRVCPTCGRVSNISVDRNRLGRSKSRTRKSVTGKYRGVNNKLSRSAKDMRDFDSPQNASIKDAFGSKKGPQIENCFDSFDGNSEPCFFCGRLVLRSVIDSHSFLCERIKNIEVLIAREHKKQNELASEGILSPSHLMQGSIIGGTDNGLTSKQYQLVKNGCESPAGISEQTISTIKCPCCSQNLDLRFSL